jgi:hypothetical protein
MGIPSYGEALKRGIQSSVGDAICIFELDLMDKQFISTSLSLIEQNKADFVVASKRHPESIDRRPVKRRVLTFLFNCWLKMNFSFPGTDTHGLKAIRATVAKSLCELSITGGEVFQTELVLLAHRLGYRVAEVPITLSEQRATMVSVLKRLPKVVHIMDELKTSLGRFPVKK